MPCLERCRRDLTEGGVPSGATSAAGFCRVIANDRFRRWQPTTSAWRINRDTRFRPTRTPVSVSSAWIRRAPWTIAVLSEDGADLLRQELSSDRARRRGRDRHASNGDRLTLSSWHITVVRPLRRRPTTTGRWCLRHHARRCPPSSSSERRVVDRQFSRDLRDRLARRPDQLNRLLTERRWVFTWSPHEPSCNE